MLERSSIGVLGVIAAALALAALAAQPRAAEAPSATVPVQRAPSPSARALRALRDGQRVAVNAARAEDLELLPGIGPRLAERIVEHRDTRGPFRSCEDLLEVHGIGRRTLERLEPSLDCSTPPPQPSKNQTTAAATAK